MFADPVTRGELSSLGVDLAVVTPSRSMEDERALSRLAPAGLTLHMASETWFDYGIGQAGTVLLVRDPPGGVAPWVQAGEVLGSATPASAAELLALVGAWLSRSPGTG
jgi:hypothetical protein